MNFFSQRSQNLKPSATFAVANLAKERKSKGLEVFDLSLGEPDFDVPSYIHDGIIDSLKSGKTKYTAVDGILELKQAIIQKFKQDNKLDYEIENISVSTGAKQVLFNTFLATLNPGDEVIIPSPYWVSYPEMVRFADGTPIILPLNNSLKIDPSVLESHITPQTKWLILNSPSNPTGVVYSEKDYKAIGEVLKRYPHVWIMSDDIYEHLIFDQKKFLNILNIAQDLKDRTLVVNGFSKAFAMTGLRLGYAAGPKTLIKALSNIQSQSTSNPSSIIQYGGLKALNGDMSFLGDWKTQYTNRRNCCLDILNSSPYLDVTIPEGAFYLFPKLKNNMDDLKFSMALLEETGVVVVAGSVFGAPHYFRMAFATSLDILKEACSRIVKFLDHASSL